MPESSFPCIPAKNTIFGPGFFPLISPIIRFTGPMSGNISMFFLISIISTLDHGLALLILLQNVVHLPCLLVFCPEQQSDN